MIFPRLRVVYHSVASLIPPWPGLLRFLRARETLLSLYLSLSAVRPTSTIRSTSGRRLSLLTQPSDRDGVLVVNNASYLNCREVWTATGAPDTLPRYDHKRFEFMSSPVGELLLTPIPLPPPSSLVDPFSLRQRSFERTVANWPTEIV